MNICLAKIGQKFVFNRSSSLVDRSNANGNQGLYKLAMIFNDIIGKNNEVFVISDNDMSDSGVVLTGLIDAKDFVEEAVKMSDVIVVVAGMSTYEKNEDILNIISSSKKPVVILCEDPRCYTSMANDHRVSNWNVVLVLHQTFGGRIAWHERFVDSKYCALQVVSAYGHKMNDIPSLSEKNDETIVVANTSYDGYGTYDRINVVASVLRYVCDVKVYGRLSSCDRLKLINQNVIGEVKYDDMQNIMRKTLGMLLVPIDKHWITSKYVECLMNGVYPLFHLDYNIALENDSCDIVYTTTSEEFRERIFELAFDKKVTYAKAIDLYCNLIHKYTDGKILASFIEKELSNV